MGEYLGFVDGLLARLHGPMGARFFLQPAMALIFAIRDGTRDAREGRPPYFWGLFTSEAEQRHQMLASGWKSVGKVFVIAIILDLVFQLAVLHVLHLIGAVIAGLILAIIPYMVLRGPVNRVARRLVGAQTP